MSNCKERIVILASADVSVNNYKVKSKNAQNTFQQKYFFDPLHFETAYVINKVD